MRKFIRWLVPKEKMFFELLAEQSQNSAEGVKELKNFIDEYPNFQRDERKSRATVIKSIELKGDEIARKIREGLDRNFKTPIDKEDILRMMVLLEDVTNMSNAVASDFLIFGVERIDRYTSRLAEISLDAANEVNKSISELRKLKTAKERYEKVCSLEKEADEVYFEAMSELFHFYKNSIDLIKYKEIYGLLEGITDKCKAVSGAVESVVAKHS